MTDPNSKPDPEDELAGTEQPFVAHLMELRDRLIKALIAVAVVAGVLAAYFVVATLKPQWLGRGVAMPGTTGTVSIVEAPSVAPGTSAPGSLSGAVRKAAPAVVSINTSTTARAPRNNDPWFRFFFGDQAEQQQ